MNSSPGGIGGSILSFALMLLLAGWAINTAVHLVMDVLPVLVGLAVAVAAVSVGIAVWRHRDYW